MQDRITKCQGFTTDSCIKINYEWHQELAKYSLKCTWGSCNFICVCIYTEYWTVHGQLLIEVSLVLILGTVWVYLQSYPTLHQHRDCKIKQWQCKNKPYQFPWSVSVNSLSFCMELLFKLLLLWCLCLRWLKFVVFFILFVWHCFFRHNKQWMHLYFSLKWWSKMCLTPNLWLYSSR